MAAVQVATTGRIHGLAGLVLFAAPAAAPFVLARGLHAGSRGWVAYSRWSGALLITFAITVGLAFRMDVQDVLRPAPAGLLETTALLVGVAWITAAGARLRRQNALMEGRGGDGADGAHPCSCRDARPV
ncbi:DUF998 domain-containing protein [Nonomuraea sp. bgisy101]|uniref:DUF998 domain-containing protein n=1 Tax=Nonomuraea sp. bgisy101 TaxID=3413784 RepID=UPI003D75762B